TNGALSMPMYRPKPRKRPMRAKTYPAQVPMTTAAVAVSAAINRDRRAALSNASSFMSERYHLKEKPLQVFIMAESLNENTISDRMGKYRKLKPNANDSVRKTGWGRVIAHLFFCLRSASPDCTGTVPAE